MKEIKQSSVAVLIGIVILLVGIEVLLIYIAYTRTSDDITFEDVNKNTTVPTEATSESTTSTSTTSTSTTSTSTTSTSTTSTSSTIITSSRESSWENSTEKKTSLETERTTALTNTTETNVATSAIPPIMTSTFPSEITTDETTVFSPPFATSTQPSLPSSLSPPPSCVCNQLLFKTSHSTTSATKTTNTTKTIRTTASKKQNFASMFSPLTMNKTTNTSTETNATEISPIFPFTPLTSKIASLPTPSSTTVSPLLIMAATTKENKPYSKITIPKFNYVLRNEEEVACVLANMTIHINLQHTKDSQIKKLTVPTDAKPTGVCAEKTINMTLSWEESAKNQVNSNKIIFNYAHDDSKFFLDSISVNVHLSDSIEIKGDTKQRLQLFSAAIKYGIFTCKVNTTVNVQSSINVDISNIYLIAFNKCSDNCTKRETNCILETVETIVIIGIIIVSIVLALILFVLYLLCYIQKEPILEDSKTA